MKLLLLGATGGTGAQIVDLALARGHHVTAFVRSPHKVTREHPRLAVVAGDPRDEAALAAALPGHDAVLSALGTRGLDNFRPHDLVQACAAATVAAMARTNVERLVLVSAAVLFPMDGLRFAFFRWFLTHVRRDLAAAEDVVRASSLAWTIARPPRLTGDAGEAYRSVRDALPADGFTISYRAVAAFMMDAVEQSTHVREVVGLAR